MDRYLQTEPRYEAMKYRRCGKSGILLPEISLGFWHNFGDEGSIERSRDIVECAFDNGITYLDFANNYGTPYGSAERNFKAFAGDLVKTHRDELIIATKAGYSMWPGPYGEWGSRKYLISSLDMSLRKMGLEYVDIFYSHRYDPETPLEETLQTLVDIVRAGKALYVGISNYPADKAAFAYKYLEERDVHCLVYQGKYNMVYTEPEEAILPGVAEAGVGYVAFSPLAQGLLTDRYLKGIPSDSRMAKETTLKSSALTPELLQQLLKWNEEAAELGIPLSAYALKWVLRRPEVTSVIIGASSVEQLKSNLQALK